VTSPNSPAVLVPRRPSRPTAPDEVGSGNRRRGVCELPGRTPAQMAIQAGKAALAASDIEADAVQWLLHTGSGPQGSQGWPMHRHIQHGVIGDCGNALEAKQNCAGALTSSLLASRLPNGINAAICTGADNWGWSDRFTLSRKAGGNPLSHGGHSAVLSPDSGFAKILGSGPARCPAEADKWRAREAYSEAIDVDDYPNADLRATTSISDDSLRASFRMMIRAVTTALRDACLNPHYVTSFVPRGSSSGNLCRSHAKKLQLPWSETFHEHGLYLGYLGVNTESEGRISLAATNDLRTDSIVVLLAVEYLLSATAIIVRAKRPPRVRVDETIRVIW
jgi:3-oxoacyl-[acyl-carrier-protein] synthase-3